MTINHPSPTRLLVGTTALGLALVLAGCADDDPSGSDRTNSAAGSDPTVADQPDPVELPITDHVIEGLPGFAAQGTPAPQDAKAFAEEHEKSVAELRRTGFRSAASLFFEGDGQQGFGLSVAVEYADGTAAEAEADRLFASNTETERGIRTRPLDVPGVADVRAASLHGRDGGTRLTGVEIVFVDGGVLHEVFAVGEAGTFELDGVVAAVAALHEQVAGHPVG